ncbi:MAG: hypothetical protein AAB433_12505, partial [Nitrospirota bacterium]
MVHLVSLVFLVQLNKRNKPDKPAASPASRVLSILPKARFIIIPLAGYGTTLLARKNFEGLHKWPNGRTLLQDAQKDRPARPQRVKARGVPLGYV